MNVTANCRQIQHFTPDREARLEKHRSGQGARVTEVLKERGIGFDVAAVWPGNRQIENALNCTAPPGYARNARPIPGSR